MGDLNLKTNSSFNDIFDNYPARVRGKMLFLKELVISTAKEIEGIDEMEMTLKWGEPSFITKCGSTVRMDWKVKTPDQYAMYFKCTSRLVETFRKVFGDTFQYEGNRAIIFDGEEEIPMMELRECIKAALTYHKVKHLPALGIKSL
ncbi:MAG: DUF1801 domain-containing protein [Saprospiraceae bacterium]